MVGLIVLAFLMTFLSMPMRTYIPVFVKDIFHRGPETYGNLLSLMGVGSICRSLGVASLGNIANKGRFALAMMIFLGLGIVGFSLSKHLPLSYAMLLLSRLIAAPASKPKTTYAAPATTAAQDAAPDRDARGPAQTRR